MAPKVLVVLTSHDRIDRLDKPTGWFLPELAHPYDVLSPKTEIVVASPKGGVAPLDPGSVEMFANDRSSADFLKKHKDVWEKTTPLKQFLGRASEFAALFYPGGHGPMYDLVNDKDSLQLIEEFYKAGKPVAAVCHGPIVFYKAKIDGKPLVEGRRVTGFTNREEKDVKLDDAMPLLLETSLLEVGADFQMAPSPWGEMIVVDGQIITGQNPASAKGVGEAIARAIGV
ncbi:DJ-1/PfpI family protein [Hirsutella rhossiliensis]|uniref:D-lactate dehydratase n=1 Tax=Hirsutella rhossiliensis TaxID=111463 RepID=A0A9P8SNG4_9HYPO|nr:DJ-1/PfpI family domain-containing protein [Hirsutella rhossiliensis]KAH0967850.1 DJ-1/PfpI family domain-containing protein [Hirsutella rhossiliensis]